jgi:hypothetical protein
MARRRNQKSSQERSFQPTKFYRQENTVETTEEKAEVLQDASSEKADTSVEEASQEIDAQPVEETPQEASWKQVPNTKEMPSVEEIMEGVRCSELAAGAYRAALLKIAKEHEVADLARRKESVQHYIVRSATSRGYWRVGRHFTTQPTTVFADELTKEQRRNLESSNPDHLKVTKVGF